MTKKIIFYLILLICFGSNKAFSQTTITSSGGSANNSSGSFSYTIGQVFYQNYENEFSVYEGIQQPNISFSSLKIDEFKNEVFEVYPNPTTDFLFIKGKDGVASINYEIYDMNGKLIQKSYLKNYQIDFTKFLRGSYLVKLIDKNSSKIFKILKK